MVKIAATYSGELHCEVQHGPSGTRLETDAPKDNHGKGERFSPTDLVGAALTTCVLTTMAIAAERDGISLKGATAEAIKEMISTPARRIHTLHVQVRLPDSVPAAARAKLEQIGENCPVRRSLHPDIQSNVTFTYFRT